MAQREAEVELRDRLREETEQQRFRMVRTLSRWVRVVLEALGQLKYMVVFISDL